VNELRQHMEWYCFGEMISDVGGDHTLLPNSKGAPRRRPAAPKIAPHAHEHTNRIDLERGAIYAANLGIRERPGSSVGRLQAVLEATVASQKLYPCSRPRIVEGTGVNFVEVDTRCSVGSQRVGQHGVTPILSGPSSPCPRLRLSQSPANPSIVRRLMPAHSLVLATHTRLWSHSYFGCPAHTLGRRECAARRRASHHLACVGKAGSV
jgi:hypothetical protein